MSNAVEPSKAGVRVVLEVDSVEEDTLGQAPFVRSVQLVSAPPQVQVGSVVEVVVEVSVAVGSAGVVVVVGSVVPLQVEAWIIAAVAAVDP